MPKNTKGFVYIIENDFGLFKIGITVRDVQERLSDIVSTSGVTAKVLKYFYSENMQEIESILHKHHKSYRTVGEWFWKIDWDFISKVEKSGIDKNLYKDIPDVDIHIQKELEKFPVITWSKLLKIKAIIGTKTKSIVLKDTLTANGYTKIMHEGRAYWTKEGIGKNNIQEYLQNKDLIIEEE